MFEGKLRLIKFILIVSAVLLASGIVFASIPPQNFSIPAQYGITKETFQGKDTTKPLIIHIQDAHCNYEAQKNMASLLEYLIKEHNLKIIMVEGGNGDVNLTYLRGYADKKAREAVADKYLRAGKISGEEYLDIISDYDLDIYGIDDEALYEAHLASFWRIDAIKEEGLSYLESLTKAINSLKPLVYSDELRRLEEKKAEYEEKTLSLAAYCQYLGSMVSSKGLNSGDYPHLAAFVESARLEKEIDFAAAELERNAFVKDLAGILDSNGIKTLLSKTQDFKDKNVTPQEYYSYLEVQAKNKIDLAGNYSHLNSYIKYLNSSKDIEVKDLLQEVSLIEGAVKEACLTSPEQKRLSQLDKSAEIAGRLLNLELTPQDYAYFKDNKNQFKTASWIDFLSQNCAKYDLSFELLVSNVIDGNLNQLEGFYQLGVEREKAFMENMQKKMNEAGQNLAVLITGGFHTPGITGILKDKGYSYVVVAPVITERGDSSLYFSVLREEKSRIPEEDSDYEP